MWKRVVRISVLRRVSLPLWCVVLLLPSITWGQQELRSGGKGATAPAPVTSTSIDADHQALDVRAVSSNPCSYGTKQFLPISISTATTTELTPSLAGASNHYYVCSVNIGPVAGAQNIALVDDDSDGCGSVTSGLAGGTTANTGWNIAVNGGLVIGSGIAPIARTNGTNRVLCLVTSAAVQTSGVIVVVAAP